MTGLPAPSANLPSAAALGQAEQGDGGVGERVEPSSTSAPAQVPPRRPPTR